MGSQVLPREGQDDIRGDRLGGMGRRSWDGCGEVWKGVKGCGKIVKVAGVYLHQILTAVKFFSSFPRIR